MLSTAGLGQDEQTSLRKLALLNKEGSEELRCFDLMWVFFLSSCDLHKIFPN